MDLFKSIKEGATINDEDFNSLYPESLRGAAEFHFTPVATVIAAANFLVNRPNVKVLDIGSGAGKFCLIGATITEGIFTGVEQRKQLCEIAKEMADKYKIPNTQFINANLVSASFSDYDAFYIFNPFMEHKTPDESMDTDLDIDGQLYDIYSEHVKSALDNLRIGTRLASYFSYGDEMPESYERVGGAEDGKLKFWIKA